MDVMIVLAGSIGGQLGADIIGHVGPDTANSGSNGGVVGVRA
jgi:hypothetical protein